MCAYFLTRNRGIIDHMIWENKIYVKEQEILLCRFNQSVSVMAYFWPELSYVQQESPLSPVRDLEPRRFPDFLCAQPSNTCIYGIFYLSV